MAKPTVLITREIPDIATELLKPHVALDQWPHEAPMLPHVLLDKVRHVDAIIPSITDHVTDAVLAAAGPQLKVVANYAVGFDNIDLKAAEARHIVVTNTPGVLTEAVAEHALALTMAVARRVVEGDQFVRAGKYEYWLPLGFLGPQLWGKTLGVVGLGRIGSWLAGMASNGLKMKILYASHHRDETAEMQFAAKHRELDTLLKEADVVSIHTPLTPETHHLIGPRELKLMKSTAILINTSRGPVVDEAALADALESHTIAGAGLDVFEHEPKVSARLKRLPNAVLTPHIASATNEARVAMAEIEVAERGQVGLPCQRGGGRARQHEDRRSSEDGGGPATRRRRHDGR